MVSRATRLGDVVTRRYEQTDTFEGYPVPGGLVEHITIETPKQPSETQRLRLLTAREMGREWKT